MRNTMLVKKMILILMAVMLLAACGCGKSRVQQNDSEKALVGRWAYSHDTEHVAAVFSEDGSAKYEDKKYSYTSDGEKIGFTAPNGENLTLRYVINGDRMYLYIKSTYVRESGAGEGALIGLWKDPVNQWTFEFTDNGTFMEDGAMTGYYYLDEIPGTVRLVYGEALEDTVFYYSLNGDELTVEYPWLMFRMGN